MMRTIARVVSALCMGCCLPTTSQATEAMLLELELNGERISRGSLVHRDSAGCRVESKDLTPHLHIATQAEWTDFTHPHQSCSIDEQLGVARLLMNPALLKIRQINLFKAAQAPESMSAESSLALDLVANRGGLRTGLILSHEDAQLSLSLNPRGHLEYWTGDWKMPAGVRLEVGDITAPHGLSSVPQRFRGLRLSSASTRSATSGLASASILLQHPSRIRMINSNAQEILGVTALPAGPYRVIGPTGSTAPGFLRVEIEGPDGAVSEQIIPWSHHAQILDEGATHWDLSANADGGYFATHGWGLSPQDSLWLNAATGQRSARLDWVTRRVPSILWTGRLGLSCRQACSPTLGASIQAPLWRGSHFHGAWQSDSRPQISISGAMGSRGNIALSRNAQHVQAQAQWTITSQMRVGLNLTRTQTDQSIYLQFHLNLGRGQTLAIASRRHSADIQISQSPTRPGELGWNMRANGQHVDVAVHQQPRWGDWHMQLSRSHRGRTLSFYPQVSTRLWLTPQTSRLGPVGEYNLVEIDTGVAGIDLIDQQGFTAQTDARGIAAFARIPTHAAVGLRVDSQRLPLDQAMPFNQVWVQTERRRAYRLVKRSTRAPVATYRLEPQTMPGGLELVDAQGKVLYISPDGYVDVEPHHRTPISMRSSAGLKACEIRIVRGAQGAAEEHWVHCGSG
ncbi:MAG: hypothetical protein ACO38B_01855 [Burkholderiaceae bacterium]